MEILQTRDFNLNANLATLLFKCNHKTSIGETLRIVGNIEELGSWEPSNSIKMKTTKDIYPIWESTTEITGPVGMEIIYKYVIYNEDQNNYYWENLLPECINRKFTIPSSGIFILNDEENTTNCYIQKISTNEKNESFESDTSFVEKNPDDPDRFNCLSYDGNQLNSNEKPFFYCINQNISQDERIMIVTALLPFEVSIKPDGKLAFNKTDESIIYSILYEMKEKGICDAVWVGMLRNFQQFTEKELEYIKDKLRELNIYMVNVPEIEYKNYWIYMNQIIGNVFVSGTIDIHNQYILDYEEYLSSYYTINRMFAEEIHEIMQENDLIMINDVHLMLIPNSLLTKNTNARVGIYFHMAFPSSDVIKTFPNYKEFLKSILLCDVIGFHVFNYARNFLVACKRHFGIFYEIKSGGFITLSYYGRHILIMIMHAGIDSDYIRSIIKRKEFSTCIDNFKEIIGEKYCFVSVDNPHHTASLYFKLQAYKKFLEKFPSLKSNTILIQVIKCEEFNDIDPNFFKELDETVQNISEKGSKDCIKIIKVENFSVPERFALFSLANSLYYLQLREGNCMFVNEFTALQDILKSEREKINYGIIISENIGVSCAIKGPIRVNPFNLNSIINALEKVYFMKEEEKLVKFKKDLEHVNQSTTFQWIKNFFMDLKKMTTNQQSIKIGFGHKLNLTLMKLSANFQHLSKSELKDSYRSSEKRILFFNHISTLQEGKSKDESLPLTPRLIKLLTALSNDPRNLMFIVSGRKRSLLDESFSCIPNLGLAAEYGFFYKYPKNISDNEWTELFKIKDWSWKDSVLKILEGFKEKTEGSYIVQKEVCISWFYQNCDIYFGHYQANEIKTHLQNIFENCNLEIVHGQYFLEIKPKSLNKGYFMSHIIMQRFIQKQDPDFILSIGDGINDEEMFNYINSVQNQLTYLKENIKLYTCTIQRKPSAAQYYLNEINEVQEYLESLNQTSHMSNKKEKKTQRLHRVKTDNNLNKSSSNQSSLFDVFSYSNL